MDLIYENEKLEKQCTNLKYARKLFGGNEGLAKSLLARINALKSANRIVEIREVSKHYE